MKTQIEIRGRRYTVRSDEEDVDLAAVAAYVDRQISEIADKSPALDDYTAAMLAAQHCLRIPAVQAVRGQ